MNGSRRQAIHLHACEATEEYGQQLRAQCGVGQYWQLTSMALPGAIKIIRQVFFT